MAKSRLQLLTAINRLKIQLANLERELYRIEVKQLKTVAGIKVRPKKKVVSKE